MENKEIKLGENSTEQRKKYIMTFRNKWITSNAGSIDDFIKIYEDIAGLMRRWKEKGIILDPDILGAVGDDYAQYCTHDEAIAQQEGFQEEVLEDYDNEESYSPILHFEINELISLKLIHGETLIYIDGEQFNQCRYVLLVDSLRNEQQYEIESIDEAQVAYNNDLETGITPEDLGITKEQEFWAHSSNLQAWVENDYKSLDKSLLHYNLAFPLLKKLSEIGDVKAKKVFKKEIAQRFVSGYIPVMIYLLKEKYMNSLTAEEFSTLLDRVNYSKLDINKLLKNIDDLDFTDRACQFLIRVKKEFQDFFNENQIYIEIGEYKLDKKKNRILSIWRVSDGALVHTLPIKQKLSASTISQDSVFIIGTIRDRIVKVWMDFLSYMELEGTNL